MSISVKAWFVVHKWTSLICTAFMLLLCVTGLPLIFHHELDHALGNAVEPPEMPADTPLNASVDGIVAAAKAKRPQDSVLFIGRAADDPREWWVSLGEKPNAREASAFYTFDARTGGLISEYPLNQGVMNVFLRLHIDMFAGLYGTLFLGLMGLVLIASLVSGAVLYGPYMTKLRFGTVRRDRSPRLHWLDLHNLIGIVTLVWFFVVGVTGVVNTLAIPMFGYWQQTQLAEMTAPYRDKPPLTELGSVEKALAAAQKLEPSLELSFMAFPGNDFASPHHYVAFMRGKTPWTSKLLKPVLVDAQSSQVVDSRALPWYITVLVLSQPLHFGDYGGMPLKILWALLDSLTIVVLGTGLYLWLKRRKVSFEAWLRAAQGEKDDDAIAVAPPSRAV